MATVYLAHDIKHDRKVAVKVLKPELAGEMRKQAAAAHPSLFAPPSALRP